MKHIARVFLFVIIFAFAVVAISASPLTPQGKTVIVTSTADSGAGTLRQALTDAKNGDVIIFDPTIFLPTAPVTIFVTSELPGLHVGNLTVDASDAGVILDGSNMPGGWMGGLQILSSDGNIIRGLQVSNFSGRAIDISGDSQHNIIGGDRNVGAGPFGQGNMLTSNGNGVVMSTNDTSLNSITGNLIGTDDSGTDALGNDTGIWITEGASGNIIGPGNTIAYNHGSGIGIQHANTLYNTITQNSINDNGGTGINLWEGGNAELDTPVIVDFDLGSGTATGISCPNCTVEIFSDASDEGANYEGRITANGSGAFSFNNGTPFVGPHLTATATDIIGNTSQFSEPVAAGKIVVVTSTADSGPGTLRQALLDVQHRDTIIFDPTIFPPSVPVTISVTSELPGIHAGNLTIDASDAGVILDGSNVSANWAGGLQIVSSSGNIIRGLQISNFSGRAIDISGDSQNNVIGGDRAVGAGPFGQGNMLTDNGNGVVLSTSGAQSNTLRGNLIGTDILGNDGLGNHSGIWIGEGANGNTIGPNNIIAYNNRPGISIQTLYNTISRNSIHDNNVAGISLWEGGNEDLAAPIIFNFDLQTGTIGGLACANCTVEIFSDSVDEGEIYEGQTTADGTGIFTFYKGAAFIGPHVTATATDVNGNTSEFSLPSMGTARLLIFQQGNNLPKTILQPKESRDLADNRIGTSIAGFSTGEAYDLGLYGQGLKRARVAISCIEAECVDWSRQELFIHPGHDAVITRLADNGFVITYVLSFWDKATYPGGVGMPCRRFKTEEEILRYLEFVKFIVDHFKDRVEIYELWNEPDNFECSQGIEVPDYINLVKRVAPVIRQAYPEAKIQVGATSGLIEPSSEAYFFGILESEIMPLVDVVAWHPFYSNSPEYNPEYYWGYPFLLENIKSTASAHGFDGEFQVNEMGWGTHEVMPPDFPRTHSPTVAAKYHGRGILMHLGLDVSAGIGADDQTPAIVNVIRNLSTLMAGAEPMSLPMQFQSALINIESFTFSLPDDEHLIVLWSNDIAVEYDPGIQAMLTLTGFSDHSVMGIDVLHGFEQPLITSEENGNLIIHDLLVKDYPIILRLSSTKHVFHPILLKNRPH